MLKLNNQYVQDIENLKDFITVIFVIIDDIYKQYIPNSIKNRLHKDLAILSDSEIITISIVNELLSIDLEKAWVFYVSKSLKDLFLKMCDRSRFNRTQKNLMTVTNEISKPLNLNVGHLTRELAILLIKIYNSKDFAIILNFKDEMMPLIEFMQSEVIQ